MVSNEKNLEVPDQGFKNMFKQRKGALTECTLTDQEQISE